MSAWGGKRMHDDQCWRHCAPHEGNTNYSRVLHIIDRIVPTDCAVSPYMLGA